MNPALQCNPSMSSSVACRCQTHQEFHPRPSSIVTMGLVADALFLQPFGDVVKLANTALVNSEAEQDSHMRATSRALLREAERAQRKVEAVWDTEVEKHGDAFRAMMVQQGQAPHWEDISSPVLTSPRLRRNETISPRESPLGL